MGTMLTPRPFRGEETEVSKVTLLKKWHGPEMAERNSNPCPTDTMIWAPKTRRVFYYNSYYSSTTGNTQAAWAKTKAVWWYPLGSGKGVLSLPFWWWGGAFPELPVARTFQLLHRAWETISRPPCTNVIMGPPLPISWKICININFWKSNEAIFPRGVLWVSGMLWQILHHPNQDTCEWRGVLLIIMPGHQVWTGKASGRLGPPISNDKPHSVHTICGHPYRVKIIQIDGWANRSCLKCFFFLRALRGALDGMSTGC